MLGENERREESPAAWEKETTLNTNTEVSDNMCNGHHDNDYDPQVSSPGTSTKDVVINVYKE